MASVVAGLVDSELGATTELTGSGSEVDAAALTDIAEVELEATDETTLEEEPLAWKTWSELMDQ